MQRSIVFPILSGDLIQSLAELYETEKADHHFLIFGTSLYSTMYTVMMHVHAHVSGGAPVAHRRRPSGGRSAKDWMVPSRKKTWTTIWREEASKKGTDARTSA